MSEETHIDETENDDPTTLDYVMIGAAVTAVVTAPFAVRQLHKRYKNYKQEKADIRDGIINGTCKDVPRTPDLIAA